MVRTTLLTLAALTLLAGCGAPNVNVTDANGNKVSMSTDGSKVSVTDDKGNSATFEGGQDGGTVKITDEKGQSTMESGTSVSEAELKVPFYPGSTEKPNSSIKADTPEATTVTSIRTTADEPKKVAEFYKSKVKAPSSFSADADGGQNEQVSGMLEDGTRVAVTAVRAKDAKETDITVVVITDKKK